MTHPEKGPQFRKQMRDYLSSVGFNNQEIDSVYDHRYVMLVKDAMSYRNLQKAKPQTLNNEIIFLFLIIYLSYLKSNLIKAFISLAEDSFQGLS